MADRLPPSTPSPQLSEWRPMRIGHFEVLRVISSTPMMDTYVVQDGDATRILRFMAPWLSDDAAFRTSFERMAGAFVGLDHPNLGRTYEFGIIESRLYTLGEHILSPSLRAMNRMLNARATLTVPTIRRIALELCAGLHAVHTLTYTDGEPIQLLYCDPFPGYIFFEPDGTVLLRDPGPWPLSWLNHKRYVIRDRSTDPYCAPEDLRGEELDVSADLYALARTLLIMRAPTPLHAPLRRVSQQLDDALAQLQSEAPRFAAVLRKATHPNRDARYTSAEALAADIAPLTEEEQQLSAAEARQFLEETRSATRKKPEELSFSLQKIAEIQQQDREERATRAGGAVMRRRTETIDLPLDALPDLKALRDNASLNRSTSDVFEHPPHPFDAPPPIDSPHKAKDGHTPGLHFEVMNAQPRASDSGGYNTLPAGPPSSPAAIASELHGPDPRVQTLTQGVRTLIHRPDAAQLRNATQDRLSGNPASALEILENLREDTPADIASAARIELGFTQLELRQHEDAVRTLTPCLDDFTLPDDQALLHYYLGLAQLALGDRAAALVHFQKIPNGLRLRYPDIAPIFRTLQ